MTELFNESYKKEFRRSLRNDPTRAEKILWRELSRDQLGVRFRRQYGIGPFVVDFYCPASRLVIELDGDSHFTPEAIEKDSIRNAFMDERGLRVLRFHNTDVYERLEGVIQGIKETLAGLPHVTPP